MECFFHHWDSCTVVVQGTKDKIMLSNFIDSGGFQLRDPSSSKDDKPWLHSVLNGACGRFLKMFSAFLDCGRGEMSTAALIWSHFWHSKNGAWQNLWRGKKLVLWKQIIITTQSDLGESCVSVEHEQFVEAHFPLCSIGGKVLYPDMPAWYRWLLYKNLWEIVSIGGKHKKTNMCTVCALSLPASPPSHNVVLSNKAYIASLSLAFCWQPWTEKKTA